MLSQEMTKFSKQISRVSFEGEFGYNSDNDQKPHIIERLFQPSKSSKLDVYIINYVIYIQPIKTKTEFAKRNGITQDKLNMFNPSIALQQYETKVSVPIDLYAPDLACKLLTIQEQASLSFTAVIDLSTLNEAHYALPNIFTTTRCAMNQLANFIYDYITKDNTIRLRRIIDGKLEILKSSINQCIKQQIFSHPFLTQESTNKVFKEYAAHFFTPQKKKGKKMNAQDLPFVQDIMKMDDDEAFYYNSKQSATDLTMEIINRHASPIQIKLEEYEDCSDSKNDNNMIMHPELLLCDSEDETCKSHMIRSHSQYQFGQGNEQIITKIEYDKNVFTVSITKNKKVQTYEMPYSVWNMTQNQELVLKSFSKQSKYLKRQIYQNTDNTGPEKSCFAEYKYQSFSDIQINTAMNNVKNDQVLQQILSSFIASKFRMLIIGPPSIANLLGRSLGLLLPPSLRQKIIYATINTEHECTHSNETQFPQILIPLSESDIKMKKSLPMFSQQRMSISYSQAQASTTDVSSSFQTDTTYDIRDTIFIPHKVCEQCNSYNHGVQLIPGVCIQCISGDSDQFHLMDYFLRPDESAAVVNLCADARSQQVVSNFCFNGHWRQICKQIQDVCMRGSKRDVKFILEHFSTSNQLKEPKVLTLFNEFKSSQHLQLIVSQCLNICTYVAELAIGMGMQNDNVKLAVQLQKLKTNNYIDFIQRMLDDNLTQSYLNQSFRSAFVVFKANKYLFEREAFDFSNGDLQQKFYFTLLNGEERLVRFDSNQNIISADLLPYGATVYNLKKYKEQKLKMIEFFNNYGELYVKMPVLRLQDDEFVTDHLLKILDYVVPELSQILQEGQAQLGFSTL
ncbi:Conserved_hypothetical protein [Hexamita inflata]|uniref:Uncharacterized protein n=1 Tax=Hexamita inflata TaxID=28002 RepID=A0AA86UDR5_9EUKA|nr:Conserved hypothetical protein [Hexamita inflata]